MLKILNSNWRNPYLIWDNSTRAELTEFLNSKKQYAVNDDDDDSIILCTEFKYSAHEGQLIVGEIFVQIYNEQPTFPIDVRQFTIFFHEIFNRSDLFIVSQNAKGFALDLLELLGKQSLGVMNNETISQMTMCLQALANVIKSNPGKFK